jgi:hypothetical protein
VITRRNATKLTAPAARAALAAVLLCAVPSGAASQDARPLPGFTVTSAAGAQVPSARLLSGTNRVLVYVTAGTASASALFDALAAWRLEPAAAGRISVIVAGPVDGIATVVDSPRTPAAGGVAWYADPDGQAGTALGITGAVTFLGGRDGAVHWTVGGVLNDPAAYEPVVRAWLGAPAGR